MIGIYQKLVEPLSPERLARLQRAEFIAKQYCNIFPTPESWKWFRRTRKSRLIAGGALIETICAATMNPRRVESIWRPCENFSTSSLLRLPARRC